MMNATHGEAAGFLVGENVLGYLLGEQDKERATSEF